MPATLVNLEAVDKAHRTTVLLDAVSLGVAERERVGIVGRNGGGKTTLVSILAGREPPDRGRVTHANDLRVGFLPQVDDLDPAATVRSLVLGRRVEHEWAGDARVRGVLGGLLGGVGLDTVVARLSGGERRRVALARLLVRDLDLLVLDEPTNHLDVEAIAELARQLRGRRGALAVVTHDRWLIDEVCDTTWEVEAGRVHAYDGGYSAYVLAKAERTRLAAAVEARRQNALRKELAWLRRGAPARTSKPRFRLDAANALVEGEPPPRDSVDLLRFASTRLGRTVVELYDATLAVGERVLFDRLTWQLAPGDRLGVLGGNGSGKTTLLRLLAGELRPNAGGMVTGRTVRAAYLPQEIRALDPSLRVLEAVEDVARVVLLGPKRELTASQLLVQLGFPPPRQWTRVGDLSGGERRRLELLRRLVPEPNLLLLDEPTNDLDIETLTALEDLLDDWPGTLVVVSHDRYFLERVTDRTVALLGDARLRDLPGGVDEYLALRKSQPPPSAATARSRSGDTRAGRRELARLERQLDTLARRESDLHARLATYATDYEKVAVLDAELRTLADERAAAEEA